jgi:hypothetical protein
MARPHTKTHKAQLAAGCPDPCGGSYTWLTCDAKTLRFIIKRRDIQYSVWEHLGSHESHPRPPGGRLSLRQQQAVDQQVLRHHDASAYQLRTGDLGPGSVPLPNISPSLANARAALYAVHKSHENLGIHPRAQKGAGSVLCSFTQLTTELSTSFLLDSSITGPVYILLATPFMSQIMNEAIDDWLVDPTDGPSVGRHGFVTDVDHSFFRQVHKSTAMFANECTVIHVGRILFKLVILRTYLSRPAKNDLDIFELVQGHHVSRIWTTHEQALAACDGQDDTSPIAVFDTPPNPVLWKVKVVQDADLELPQDLPLVTVRHPVTWTSRPGLTGGARKPRCYRPPYLLNLPPGPRPKPKPVYGRSKTTPAIDTEEDKHIKRPLDTPAQAETQAAKRKKTLGKSGLEHDILALEVRRGSRNRIAVRH